MAVLAGVERNADPSCGVRTSVTIPIGALGFSGDFISFDNLGEPGEHIAIGLGDWRRAHVPLVRIHSECLTGDVFGSMRCDCGPQLQESIETIRAEGGLLLYLRQEGRGIGLYAKLDAYRLQLSGLDTYEANRSLGFGEDLRSYLVAARMLEALGVDRIRLLTNNAEKVQQLQSAGIDVVEAVRTGLFINVHNQAYLEAKQRRAQCSHASSTPSQPHVVHAAAAFSPETSR
jgi:GTP cyclohydrolase II